MKRPPAQTRQTTHAVGRKATPAKPAAAAASATGGKGTATGKHGGAPAKHQPKKARKWSPDGDVALCSARAVAESLRLTLGVPVSHDDVLALYWLVADDPDAGASILGTLDAARRQLGVAYQAQPRYFLASRHDRHKLGVQAPGLDPDRARIGEGADISPFPARVELDLSRSHTEILGLDLPQGEPHAVVAHDGAWWSWGEPYTPEDFPGAIIDEAWAVTWS